jgi:hypothetical protein
MNDKIVSVFPAVQHRHSDGDIVTVRLRRKNGAYTVECPGCQTRFIYKKPTPSLQSHHKSPLLREVKGNFDGSEE